MTEFLGTSTYDPADNKIRFYPFSRLDSEDYQRVKSAGFIWAPKQQLFVAPMWTPDREDLMLELCGEIGDEDTSLVERAEERAERFEEYSDKRLEDAERARESVSAITDHIPMGQPILVGHHSERHARKDAERIENGMRKAVNMWETSKYWAYRAQGAIRAAKYKERPDVRARRIKGLEADKRKQERTKADAEKFLKLWNYEPMNIERAVSIANYDHISKCFTLAEYPREAPKSQYEGYMSLWSALTDEIITAAQAKEISIRVHTRAIEHCNRWINHYDNRLTYEKAMLDDQGASDLLKPKPRPEQLPLCNYRLPDGITLPNPYHRGETLFYPQFEMTKAEYAKIYTDRKGTRNVENSHRIRTAIKPGTHIHGCVFITDSKVHEKPEPVEVKPVHTEPRILPDVTAYQPPERTEFDDLKDTLKAGVKVVSAPQLFPTPPEIAEKMIDLAEIPVADPTLRILEPSAGTGNLLEAIFTYGGEIVAVEKNLTLVDLLRVKYQAVNVIGADFLLCNGNLGKFSRIVMNPPFDNGSDIKHIDHALTMLSPGGKLVALCANGPRQRAAFMDRADYWEDFPAGSFKEQGTGVNVALMVINA